MFSGDTTTSTPTLTPSTAGGDTSTTPLAGGPEDGRLGFWLSEEELRCLTEAVVVVIHSSGTAGIYCKARMHTFMHWHSGVAQDLKGGGGWSGTPVTQCW